MSLRKVKKTCLWVIVCQGGCYDKISSFPPFIHLINTSTPFVVTCNTEEDTKLQVEWKMNISVYRKLANNNNMSFGLWISLWRLLPSLVAYTSLKLNGANLLLRTVAWILRIDPTYTAPIIKALWFTTSWSMGSPAHLINQFTGKDTY